jgi:hypothetical protein
MYDGAAWIHTLGVEMDFTIGSSGGIIVAPDQSIIDEVTGDASFLAEAALLTREMGGKHMVLGCGKDQLWLKFREEGWEKQLEILRGWKSFSQFSAPFADDDQAAEFVQVVQDRQGFYISCIEEIAFRRGFIDAQQLLKLGEELKMTDYGQYLIGIAKEAMNHE